MILTMSPWVLRNYFHFKRIIPVCTISVGFGLWASGYEASGQGNHNEALYQCALLKDKYPPDLIQFDKQATAEGVRWIKANFPEYLYLIVKRIPVFWLTSHSSEFGIDKSITEYLKEKK